MGLRIALHRQWRLARADALNRRIAPAGRLPKVYEAMKLSPQAKELYRRIDEVAFYIWDPIGVSEFPIARDEYETYVWGLIAQVKSNDLDKVVSFMESIVTGNMGLSFFDRPRAIRAAEVMLQWNSLLCEHDET